MNLFRLAARFERKIIFAGFNTFQNIEKIRRAVQELSKQPDLDSKITANLNNVAKMYYLNARDYGISDGQHAGYLRQLLEGIEQLPDNDKTNQIKTMIFNMVPIGLAAQRKKVPTPTVTPTVTPGEALPPISAPVYHWNQVSGTIPAEPTGAAYTAPALTPNEKYQQALARAQALADSFAQPLPPPSPEYLEMQKKMEEINKYVQENKGKYQ